MSLVHFSLTRIFSISTNNYRKKHKMGSTASFGTIIHMNIIWSFTHIGTIAAKKEREYSVHVNNKITDQNGKYTVWCFFRSVVSMFVCVCVKVLAAKWPRPREEQVLVNVRRWQNVLTSSQLRPMQKVLSFYWVPLLNIRSMLSFGIESKFELWTRIC